MGMDLITAAMVAQLIRDIRAYPAYLTPPAIVAVLLDLDRSEAVITALLSGRPLDTTRSAAEERVRGADREHDLWHRYGHGFLTHLAQSAPDPAVRQAAEQLLELLFPNGLTVINRPYEVEVAAATQLEARLTNPTVVAGLATLAPIVPELPQILTRATAAGRALGEALAAVRAFDVDRAGNPFDPALFRARTDAVVWWSAFVTLVEATYRGDAPANAAAREALLGPWRRLTAVSAGVRPTPPAPAPGDAPA